MNQYDQCSCMHVYVFQVEEEICGFDEEQSHKDSKPRSTTIEL